MRTVATTEGDRKGTEPYREAAALYFTSGWHEPLPLPYKAKASVPVGFTGRHDGPSRYDVQAWIDGREGTGNIAIRLPEHIVGIDVDNYNGKAGAATLAAFEAAHGALPITWRSTSREDGTSGIYLFRVPPGLAWPGEVGPDIEIVQRRHRYAIVWPSIHPEDRLYRWITPDGLVSTVPPDPDLLPALPNAWVAALTAGKVATVADRADLGAVGASSWIAGASPSTEACRRVDHALATALVDLAGPGSSHESARTSTMRLASLAHDGHGGVRAALAVLGQAFLEDVTRPGRDHVRTPDEARGEWASLVVGAIERMAVNGPPLPDRVDPCVNPFFGIVPPSATGVSTHLPSVTSVEYLPGREAVATATLTNVTSAAASAGVEPLPLPEVEHSTWWPVDLAGVWDGDEEPERAEILTRTDGIGLFYRGQLNGLIGESESGKSWLAQEAVRQVLGDGGTVHYYDFEDTARGIVTRLKALDVPRDEIERFSYMNPDEPVMTGAAPQAWQDLVANLAQAPDLIVIDGYNAAMGSQGLSMDSNTEVTAFVALLRKMTATGAAVVTIDHVPKNKDNAAKGGIGAQAKRAGITGSSIKVEVDGDAYPAPGKIGYLRLSADKDRRGAVREHAVGDHVAMVTINSTDPSGLVEITLNAPDPNATPKPAVEANHYYMEKISAEVANHPDALYSKKQLRDCVTGGGSEVRHIAACALIERGYLDTVPDEAHPRMAPKYRHARRFARDSVDDLIGGGGA